MTLSQMNPAEIGVDVPPGYADRTADYLSRLHKVEGQIRGTTRMVADSRYRIDVLTQVSAVTKALQQVAVRRMMRL